MNKNQDVRNFAKKLRVHGLTPTMRHTTSGLMLTLGETGTVYPDEQSGVLTIGLGRVQDIHWIKLVRLGLGRGYNFVDYKTGDPVSREDAGWLLRAAQSRGSITMNRMKQVA